jgi:energy-converting hydrogenase Eha subunit G
MLLFYIYSGGNPHWLIIKGIQGHFGINRIVDTIGFLTYFCHPNFPTFLYYLYKYNHII